MRWIDHGLDWLDSVGNAYPILQIPIALLVLFATMWTIIAIFYIIYHGYFFIRNAENWLIIKMAKKSAETQIEAMSEEEKIRRTNQIIVDEAFKREIRKKNETK